MNKNEISSDGKDKNLSASQDMFISFVEDAFQSGLFSVSSLGDQFELRLKIPKDLNSDHKKQDQIQQ